MIRAHELTEQTRLRIPLLRWSSWLLMAKCLAHACTPWAWRPCTNATPIREASRGSSP